jgi:HK97 family phage prohead protease
MDAPRDNLTRSVPFHLERADDDNDGLTLEGYAAVFDSVTRIDSWEGTFDETIKRGAFAKTLKERTPVLQFDHGHHPLVGSIPIGAITRATEDDHGVYVKARLHDNWLTQPVRDAIASGAIDGMSFRFSVVRDSWTERSGDVPLREVVELKSPELGPVVFPAYQATSVGVRSEIQRILGDLTALRALADALVLGTSTDDAAPQGTSSQDAAAPPAPPAVAPGTDPSARSTALPALTHPRYPS